MKPHFHDDITATRRAAEARVQQINATRKPPDEGDLRRLQHELEVHQIELEMQNEELQSARMEIEAGLERYADLFDFAPVSYFNLSVEGAILLANLTCASLLGVERGQLLNRRFSLFVAMHDRSNFSDFLDRVFAAESMQMCELSLIPDDGMLLSVSIKANRSSDGKECRIVMIDDTERRQADVSLAASENHLRVILNAVPECVKLLDAEGRLLEINPAGLRMIEADSLEQVENQSVYPQVTEEHRDAFIALNQRIFRGESGLLEFQLVGLKGTRRWLKTHATPLRDATGQITAQLAITWDLTESKQANAIANSRTETLHALATGKSLTDTLTPMLEQLEAIAPDMYSSILLFEPTGQYLEHCASPRLPAAYCNAINGIVIGPGVGSCGTAAFRREQVIVEDIASDPLWNNYRELALEHELRACWSTPILDSHENLLGTFAIYYKNPGPPRKLHLKCIELTISLAAIAIRRQQSKVALLRSESRHRRLVQSNIIGVTIATVDGRVTEANDYFLGLIGYTLDDVTSGRLRWDSITPREWDGVDAKAVKDLLSGADSALFEKEYFHKNGIRVPVLIAANLLEGGSGECFCLIIDLSESKRTAAALKMKEHAIQSITQGIVITDAAQPDNPIIYVNRGFELITGYAAREIMGQNCRFLQGRDTDPVAVAELRNAFSNGQSCSVELLNYRKDGTAFWNQLLLTPVHDACGLVTQFIGVQIDVTARRKTEAQLLQSQKMEAVGQLAGGIAHDFNNLLTIIDGYTGLLLGENPQSPSLREGLAEIQAASTRAADLTRGLLAFGRQHTQSPVVLNVNSVVEETLRLLHRLIGNNVQIRTLLDPALGNVRVDWGQISQVLMNLTLNARDSMPTGGTITIQTQNIEGSEIEPGLILTDGSYVLLSVTDTGSGMSPEIQSRIFDPFYTTKPVGKGTGLGLSTVHGIVLQSGGEIKISSQVGHGTTFRIYLPQVHQEVKKPTPHSASGLSHAGTETILLVEDEEPLRRATLTMLTGFGYTVLTAGDFDHAIQVNSDYPDDIHLLVTDIVMPGKNGSQLADHICQTRPAMRVIFLSGFIGNDELRHHLMQQSGFIQKPFSPSDLLRTVRKMLDS